LLLVVAVLFVGALLQPIKTKVRSSNAKHVFIFFAALCDIFAFYVTRLSLTQERRDTQKGRKSCLFRGGCCQCLGQTNSFGASH
jgi:hypothetical protein